MNYRHIYHAGNFADVFKHWVLCLLLEKLSEKPTPFCVLDTHAGIGLYNLQDANAQKTKEYTSGIELFLAANSSELFRSYSAIVKPYYTANLYPGSPKIIQDFLRTEDRLLLAELHPEDYAQLQDNMANDKRVKTFMQDAYQTIKAVLPFREGRGLILIDPPFEKTDEFNSIIKGLSDGLKRFAHGIYAIWYPIKNQNEVHNFYRQLTALNNDKILCVELHAPHAVSNQLAGCGLVIINAPWQLDNKLNSGLPELLQNLQIEAGRYKVEYL